MRQGLAVRFYMGFVFAVSLLFNWAIAADTAQVTSYGPSINGHDSACAKQLEELGCASLKADPEIANKVLKCDGSDSMIGSAEMGRACLNNVAGVWGELLEFNAHDVAAGIVGSISQNLKEQGQPARARQLFLNACQSDPTCLKNLFHAAKRRYPSAEEQAKLEKIKNQWLPSPASEMEYYWNLACGPGLLCNSKDEWFLQQQDKIFGIPKREVTADGIQKIQEFLKSKHNKYLCLNSVGRTEMWCYGIASVVDPLLVAGLATKLPKIAKLAKATESAAAAARTLELSRLQKAEKILGRKIDPESPLGKAIERAHRVGEGELGRDKVRPAGINPDGTTNYTNRQLDEKRKILEEAGLNHDQVKALMDEGVVGKSTVIVRATAVDAKAAQTNLDFFEREKGIVDNQTLKGWSQSLKACGDLNKVASFSAGCSETIAKINREFASALKGISEDAGLLREKLAAASAEKAADEKVRIEALFDRIYECVESPTKPGCAQAVADSKAALGLNQIRRVNAPTAEMMAKQELENTRAAIRNKADDLAGYLSPKDLEQFKTNLRAAGRSDQSQNRILERQTLGHDGADYQAVSYRKAIQSYLGEGARPSITNSKAELISADGTRKIVFEPNDSYFTVQERINGQWKPVEMSTTNDGLLLRRRDGNQSWVGRRHFQYRTDL